METSAYFKTGDKNLKRRSSVSSPSTNLKAAKEVQPNKRAKPTNLKRQQKRTLTRSREPKQKSSAVSDDVENEADEAPRRTRSRKTAAQKRIAADSPAAGKPKRKRNQTKHAPKDGVDGDENEPIASTSRGVSTGKKPLLKTENKEISDSDSDDEDFEEVPGMEELGDVSDLPLTDNVEVVLEPHLLKKKKKKYDIREWFRLKMNKYKRDTQLAMHKVHRLCLLANGFFINTNILNNEELQCRALSIVPAKFHRKPDRVDLDLLAEFVKWLLRCFQQHSRVDIFADLSKNLCAALQATEMCSVSSPVFNFIFILIWRAIGLPCRFVRSFYFIPQKPPNSELELTDKQNEKSSDLKQKPKAKSAKSARSSSRQSSTEARENESKKAESDSLHCWAEVYLRLEDKWVAVDAAYDRIDQPKTIVSRMDAVAHVISWDEHNAVKDVTARYVDTSLPEVRRLRVCDDWWAEVLREWRSAQQERDDRESAQLSLAQLNRPLPKTIGSYKNHPLYVLQRHFLKFEAVYPPDIAPVGYVGKDAVYPRQALHTLRSRQTWLKEGRMVRLKEEPYKVVKARPTPGRQKMGLENPTLDVFGHWQTEIYIPPIAHDGKVPRNEFGNVDLFKPWMLPTGTVHLRDMPGLLSVAKKLDLDCVPAIIGWDQKHGLDGWVVCEEHERALRAAWEEDQENRRLKEEAGVLCSIKITQVGSY